MVGFQRFLQDIAVSSLLILLDACMRSATSPSLRACVFSCIRSAASNPDWSKELISTWNALHVAMGSFSQSPLTALKSTPEAATLVILRNAPFKIRKHLGSLHINSEPRRAVRDHVDGDDSASLGVCPRLSYFMECLCRIAPNEIMNACKGPVLEYIGLSPEVCILF
jgi:hypothetical protein